MADGIMRVGEFLLLIVLSHLRVRNQEGPQLRLIVGMTSKRSYTSASGPLSPAQLRRKQRDELYRTSHSGPGNKFVECDAGKIMIQARASHRKLDLLNQQPAHHGRLAAGAAATNGFISNCQRNRDCKLFRMAGVAKYETQSFASKGCSLGGPVDASLAHKTFWADVDDEEDNSSIEAPLPASVQVKHSVPEVELASGIRETSQSDLSVDARPFVPMRPIEVYSPECERTQLCDSWAALASQHSNTIALLCKHIENLMLAASGWSSWTSCPLGPLIDVPLASSDSSDNGVAVAVDALYEDVFAELRKVHAGISSFTFQVRLLEQKLETSKPVHHFNLETIVTELTQSLVPLLSSSVEKMLTTYDASIHARFAALGPLVVPLGTEPDSLEQIFDECQFKQVM